MTEEQEQLVHALRGAIEGVCCAVEQQIITPTQIQCLLNTLVDCLVDTLH